MYLDRAGAALPSASQLDNLLQNAGDGALSPWPLLANPRSFGGGPAASRADRPIRRTRDIVMDHFNARPGLAATACGQTRDDGVDGGQCHPGYNLVFTSGATESLQIILERFP